ncbi:MAG: hypothetical protein JWL96_2406 [Sphingomonas bacterium]|uniref:hypothetical protein n=1 Tax=Sphingomonas bacterium TaxID=1895847 RepID=UPI00260722CA|nr:hypothetical protein [Sphingomonas bacterium]MDB5710336.1 hypothetical protein [Sphingomonas bacterium]
MGKDVIGWKLDASERAGLLDRFEPRWREVVADHVTLMSDTADAPLPGATHGEIVGRADDGHGVEALVMRIDGTTARPGGGTYHITWSLGPGRTAAESNDVIGEQGWLPFDEPIAIALFPARF